MKKFLIVVLCTISPYFVFAQYGNGIKMEPIIKTDTTSIGQKIQYPKCANAEFSMYKITIPAGSSTGWHMHSFPVFAFVEKGDLTVQIKDNKTLTFHAGQSFAEVINTMHNGINSGSEELVLFAIFLGEKNKPLSIHSSE